MVGITEKMLIQQLRDMEADGLIERKAYPEIPPRVEYSLTPVGVSLRELLPPLCDWGAKHMTRIGERHLGGAPTESGAGEDKTNGCLMENEA